jgi:hypothetical protein
MDGDARSCITRGSDRTGFIEGCRFQQPLKSYWPNWLPTLPLSAISSDLFYNSLTDRPRHFRLMSEISRPLLSMLEWVHSGRNNYHIFFGYLSHPNSFSVPAVRCVSDRSAPPLRVSQCCHDVRGTSKARIPRTPAHTNQAAVKSLI